jgi:hypothetical protein
MTDDQKPPTAQERARQARLSEALRQNLKRRKSQARGRAEDQSGDTAVDPTPSALQDTDPEK